MDMIQKSKAHANMSPEIQKLFDSFEDAKSSGVGFDDVIVEALKQSMVKNDSTRSGYNVDRGALMFGKTIFQLGVSLMKRSIAQGDDPVDIAISNFYVEQGKQLVKAAEEDSSKDPQTLLNNLLLQVDEVPATLLSEDEKKSLRDRITNIKQEFAEVENKEVTYQEATQG